MIRAGIDRLLASDQTSTVTVLWSLRYTQLGLWGGDQPHEGIVSHLDGRVMCLPPPCLDLAFDDELLETVQTVWKRVMGDDSDDHAFMKFDDRNEEVDDGDGDEAFSS